MSADELPPAEAFWIDLIVRLYAPDLEACEDRTPPVAEQANGG